MTTIELKNQIVPSVFTHDMLASALRGDTKDINDKIYRMTRKGDIVRIKRGVYCFGEVYRDVPVDLMAAANMILAPSYVSFEYALSYHGLIPERVSEVTSAALRSKAPFETPVGRFGYRKVPMSAFAIGVDWSFDKVNGGRLIATPEKALCDKIRSDRGLGSMTQQSLADYVEYDLRIDMEELDRLDAELVRRIAMAYRSRLLRTLAAMIGKRRTHG